VVEAAWRREAFRGVTGGEMINLEVERSREAAQ
jgi:hypothetical protein